MQAVGFRQRSAGAPGSLAKVAIRFVDAVAESGLAHFVQENGDERKLHIPGSVGGGVAVGARVVLTAGGRVQVKPVGEASGFLSTHDPRLHLGLGAAVAAERFEVHWPDGRVQTVEGLPADRLVVIQEGSEAFVSDLPR